MSAADPVTFRVSWFAPDRPVDGGTVFVRPEPDDTVAGTTTHPEPSEAPGAPESPGRNGTSSPCLLPADGPAPALA